MGRTRSVCEWLDSRQFISTHSPRVGRTKEVPMTVTTIVHFNSLAPCGANRDEREARPVLGIISTHSPRVGRTLLRQSSARPLTHFNSLAPCGANPRCFLARQGKTGNFNSLAPCGANLEPRMHTLEDIAISTHSPRVGRTDYCDVLRVYIPNFNSLAPCGANRNG